MILIICLIVTWILSGIVAVWFISSPISNFKETGLSLKELFLILFIIAFGTASLFIVLVAALPEIDFDKIYIIKPRNKKVLPPNES
jgi:hypothetical protein